MQATMSRSRPQLVPPGVWTSGVLLGIMLLNLAMALRSAEWADGLGALAPVVLGGFLLGMAMSLSRWDGLFPVLHSLISGLVWVLIWVGRSPQIPANLDRAGRVDFIGRSLWEWVLLLFSDEPARSNLVFILELSFLLWWLGYLAAWAVLREGRVWRAILPIGLVMLVNLYYGPSALRFYFAIFIITGLLLAVRANLAEQELTWRHFRVRYANDIQFDFLRDGFFFALLIVAVTFFAPNAASNSALSPALDPLREPWQQVQSEWRRLFSSLNYQASGVRPAFGDTLSLGGPRNLGDTVIMDVRASAGRYWRAVAYDTYRDNRWTNTSRLTQSVDFANHVRTPDFQARREITQTITTYTGSGGVLFGAPQPVRVSLKASADLGVIEATATGKAPLAEITMLRRRGEDLRPGETYLVISSLSNAFVEDLQEAGEDYPGWVTGRYLQIPDSLPPRVRELARNVTASAQTPYDKVLALETFLRAYEYNDQIAAPPPGVDGVDYFLFDIKQGYCDYYATSLVMMARSLGIPARVSAGYTQGEYMPDLDAYRVREHNGHSWPEVYFPGYGWVEFEPTASEEVVVRTNRPPDAGAQGNVAPTPEPLVEEEGRFGEDPNLGPDNQSPDAGLQDAFTGSTWLIGLGGMMFLVLIAAFVLVRPSPWRSRRALLDPQFAVKLYGLLIQWANRLGLRLLPSQTPNEHAAVIVSAVPEGRPAIVRITDLYVHERYSPELPDETQAQDALMAWTTLQPSLRRHWLQQRLGPFGRLFRR